MKVLLTAIFILAMAMPVMADDVHEACTELAKLAEVVMEKRQEGVAMPEMMAVVTDPEHDLIRTMIVNAYEEPRWNSASIRHQTICEFRDSWYLKCYKILSR